MPGAAASAAMRAPPLVDGIAVGVEQADHETFDATGREPASGGRHAGIVERGVDAAVGAEALTNLGDALSRNERHGPPSVHVERVRQSQALDLQHVAKAFGDEQAETGARALDQRVHRDGSAVHDDLDLAWIDAVLASQLLEAGLDRGGEIRRRRRDLQAGDGPSGRVEEREIGERAADVDAEPVASHVARAIRVSQHSGRARSAASAE